MSLEEKVKTSIERIQLKETGGADRFGITGVRWAESSKRKKNQGIITIPKKNKNTKKLLEEVKCGLSIIKIICYL